MLAVGIEGNLKYECQGHALRGYNWANTNVSAHCITPNVPW